MNGRLDNSMNLTFQQNNFRSCYTHTHTPFRTYDVLKPFTIMLNKYMNSIKKNIDREYSNVNYARCRTKAKKKNDSKEL